MKNNRGQALIEFIIVLPVFMFLVMGMIDFGTIIYEKYQLENEVDYIVDLYLQGLENDITSYAAKKNIRVDYQKTGNTVSFELEKKVVLHTPGLNKVLSSPYPVSIDRVIYDE